MFKIFNGKKNDYFLELKDDAGKAPAIEKTETAEAPVKVEEPVAAVEAPETQPETVTPEKKAKPVAAKATQKTASKNGKTATAKVEAQSAPAPVVEETPAWVKALYTSKKETEEATFATKYLIDSNMSRRRPGPSLNAFKGMARQVKKG